VLLSSTPTISGSSRIEIAYDQSDQRKFHVACPSCNEYQELVFKNLQWEHNEDGQIQKSWYMCEENGCVIEEADKSAMLDTGYWKANATPISPKIRGYHLNALYSPFFTWTEVGEEFLLSKKSRETLKTFTNTVLAETFSDLVEEIDSSDLQQRSEDYEIDPLPEEILLITAGVDTQDDRLEASIWGWGRDHECWLIDNVIIHGKPNTPQVWIDLDTILSQTYDTVYGTKLPIAATFVDSGGHFTQNVYAYTKPRQGRRIYSIKGRSSLKITDEPLIKNRPTKVKGGAHLWLITVGVAKNLIMHNLQLTDYGAGYIHLPKSADEEFFAQLTSEKLVETYKAGSRIQKFVKTRARNEALDCLVYAMAAVYMLSPNWDILDSKKNKQAALLGDVKAEDESVIILDKGRTRQKRRNQSSSWMDD
jgi:phage terminase large subunit GpA-like protein